jgi:hypothetical protein
MLGMRRMGVLATKMRTVEIAAKVYRMKVDRNVTTVLYRVGRRMKRAAHLGKRYLGSFQNSIMNG